MRINKNFVTWSPTYSVGIKIIDDQHKRLFNMVNEIYNYRTKDKEEEQAYFQAIIRQTVNFVKIHFATEEQIMRAAKLKGYHEHKKAHNSFILSLVEFIRDLESGKKVTILSFLVFIKDWLLSHIAITDKQYFERLIKNTRIKAGRGLEIAEKNIA
jgi:hemerythrin